MVKRKPFLAKDELYSYSSLFRPYFAQLWTVVRQIRLLGDQNDTTFESFLSQGLCTLDRCTSYNQNQQGKKLIIEYTT